MSQIEQRPGLDGATPPVLPRVPVWPSPPQLATVVLFLYALGCATGVGFRDWGSDPLTFLRGYATVFLSVGLFLMLMEFYRWAIAMGWLAAGFIALLCGLVILEPLEGIYRLRPGTYICLLSAIVFTASVHWLDRKQWLRYEQLRASMTEPDRFGDVRLTRPAAPAQTNIAARKGIDGTTEQG
jgi:hypothetical protein